MHGVHACMHLELKTGPYGWLVLIGAPTADPSQPVCVHAHGFVQTNASCRLRYAQQQRFVLEARPSRCSSGRHGYFVTSTRHALSPPCIRILQPLAQTRPPSPCLGPACGPAVCRQAGLSSTRHTPLPHMQHVWRSILQDLYADTACPHSLSSRAARLSLVLLVFLCSSHTHGQHSARASSRWMYALK